MICYAGSPCGRDSQRTMDPAKVVVREVQCQGCFQIVPLFREGVGKPSEPLAPLAERSVLPLDVRGSSTVQVRPAAHCVLLDADEARWTVAFGNTVQPS